MHHPTPAPPPDKRVFHALDAARGIAALIIVVVHLPTTMRGEGFANAHLAVDFFFGLSGFVLAHAYLRRLASGQMGWREFAMVRLVRLYPLYLLSLLALLACLAGMWALSLPTPWTAHVLAGKLPFALLMLPSPSLDPNGYLYPFNVAAWSIAFELAINMVFALVCMRFPSARWRGAIIVVSGLLLAVQLVVQGEVGGASWNSLLAGIPRVFFSFFLGVQLYEWHRRGAPARPAPAVRGYAALLPLALLFVCLFAPAQLWIKLVSIFAFFPALILVLSATELPEGPLGSALRRMGVWSYAIYVLHGTVLEAWMAWYAAAGRALPTSGLTLALLFGVVLAASGVADRCFDRPVRASLQTLLRKRRDGSLSFSRSAAAWRWFRR